MSTETPLPVPASAPGWYFFDTLMSRHGKTKVDNNTYLSRDETPEGDLLYVVTLHETAILTFNRTRRTVRLRHGRWHTDLTRRRMSTYLATHGLRVTERRGSWQVERYAGDDFVSSEPYVEGMEVAL